MRIFYAVARKCLATVLAAAVLATGVIPAALDGHVPTSTELASNNTQSTGPGHNHAFCAVVGASPGLSVPPPTSTLSAAPLRDCALPDIVVDVPAPSSTSRWQSRAPPVV